MKNINLLFIIIILFFNQSCNQKYKNVQIGEDEVSAYCNVYTKLNTTHKEFLIYIEGRETIDSTVVENYDEVSQIIDNAGFIDANLFLAVHNKLKQVINIISNYQTMERYPGLVVSNLDFLENASKQYQKLLEDSTLSQKNKELYRKSKAQIDSTRQDLIDKQEKNLQWTQLIKNSAVKKCNIILTDSDVMKLTILEKEISEI